MSAKVNPSVRAEVVRLLGAEPRGLTSLGMSRISRMNLPDVEAALAELEAAGDAIESVVVYRGHAGSIWRRR